MVVTTTTFVTMTTVVTLGAATVFVMEIFTCANLPYRPHPSRNLAPCAHTIVWHCFCIYIELFQAQSLHSAVGGWRGGTVLHTYSLLWL